MRSVAGLDIDDLETATGPDAPALVVTWYRHQRPCRWAVERGVRVRHAAVREAPRYAYRPTVSILVVVLTAQPSFERLLQTWRRDPTNRLGFRSASLAAVSATVSSIAALLELLDAIPQILGVRLIYASSLMLAFAVVVMTSSTTTQCPGLGESRVSRG